MQSVVLTNAGLELVQIPTAGNSVRPVNQKEGNTGKTKARALTGRGRILDTA